MTSRLKHFYQGLAAASLLTVAAQLHADTQPVAPTTAPVVQSEQMVNAPIPVQPAIESTKASVPNATAPVNNKANTAGPNTAGQLANLLGGLTLILVLIFGLSWFVKRFSQGGFMQNPVFKVVASMPLGTRERLMLVAVGEKQILLGVTATQISNLHVFDHPVVAGDKDPSSDFSQKLMAILQQKNISSSDNPSRPNRQA
jgi:flagellar protein FliO/FliZ